MEDVIEQAGIMIDRGEKESLSATERRKLLFEWNQTQANYPRHCCLHQLFEEQAEKTPDNDAVECQNRRLTYRTLNIAANQVAHHLRSLGVGPEVLVGICVEPSLEMVIGLLGILKSGGAYVPLDSKYPKDRLTFMVADAAVPVLLTQEKFLAVLPPSSARVVCLEAILSSAGASGQTNPKSGATADNLAYVIYTSGSTGRPKGVMIPHRGLVNYLTWAVTAYRVAEGIGAPVHSSISFDLTITGLFAPLLAGRCVYMLPNDPELASLSGTLRRNMNFSLVKITPAHLELLQTQLSPNEVASRTGMFVIGGEALLGEKLAFWQEHTPDTVLVNEYGPTETVVGCCVYFMPKGQRVTGPVVIGRPIANTQLYVLNQEMSPVPVGTEGELYIGGDGVARGYLNRPELTAQCFVPNPFVNGAADKPSRLYKTGDLVRYRPDGNLEFLGRMDDRIKIRGYRIEPGEIESVLAAHPDLKGAVVVDHERTGGKYLAAYVQTRGQRSVSPGNLRQFLRDKLPDYMIPTAFITVETFPLTQNGKVDRRALPPPDLTARDDYVAPRSDGERKMAQIWEKILDRPRVGLRDNFFDLGGHSLLAAALIKEVNRSFNVEFGMVAVFQFSTVDAMAWAVQQNQDPALHHPRLVRIASSSAGPPFVFLNAPFGVAQLFRTLDGARSFFVSEIPSSPETLRAATRCDWKGLPTVEEMAAPHAAAIKAGGFSGPWVIAGFSYGGILAFEVAHQLQAAGVPVEAVFLFDSDIRWPHWECFKHAPVGHAWNCVRFGFRSIWLKSVRAVRWQRTRWMATRAPQSPAGPALSEDELAWELYIRIWLNALKHYQPRKLNAWGVLFRAEISVYRKETDYDGCLGWSAFFTRGVQVSEVPGDHESMWKEPNVQALGRACAAAIAALKKNRNAK